jgi:exonuclease V gamma subunit
LQKKQAPSASLNAAQRKWRGSDFSRGESEDPYFERSFGKNDPLDKDFEKISMNILSPLLNHCSAIIL